MIGPTWFHPKHVATRCAELAQFNQDISKKVWGVPNEDALTHVGEQIHVAEDRLNIFELRVQEVALFAKHFIPCIVRVVL